MRGVKRPAHRTSTRHLAAAYPFVAAPGLGSEGSYIGGDTYGGGAYVFDQWVQYQKTISSPNMAFIGSIGSAKSSLLKTMMLRGAVFGRRSIVIDVKASTGPPQQRCEAPWSASPPKPWVVGRR
jgi:hypothetical protein